MKNIFKKIKTYLVAIVCLILILAGYGGKTVYDENTVPGESQAVVQELPEATVEQTGESVSASAESTEALPASSQAVPENSQEVLIDPDGTYTTAEDVALYIHTYGELPQNFMTKKEAKALGWSGGSLKEYAPGMCIGGDYFGNYEGMLPNAKGREYHECDIDTLGADSRGTKRIVFSNDGLIYYTEDHYDSFELLYGEE